VPATGGYRSQPACSSMLKHDDVPPDLPTSLHLQGIDCP